MYVKERFSLKPLIRGAVESQNMVQRSTLLMIGLGFTLGLTVGLLLHLPGVFVARPCPRAEGCQPRRQRAGRGCAPCVFAYIRATPTERPAKLENLWGFQPERPQVIRSDWSRSEDPLRTTFPPYMAMQLSPWPNKPVAKTIQRRVLVFFRWGLDKLKTPLKTLKNNMGGIHLNPIANKAIKSRPSQNYIETRVKKHLRAPLRARKQKQFQSLATERIWGQGKCHLPWSLITLRTRLFH